MQRLVIHIGSPKAGSSSLQAYMHLNTNRLRARSILYPRTGRHTAFGGDAHHNLGYSLRPDLREQWFQPAQGGWPEVLEEIAESEAGVALVSTESLFGVPDPEVRQLRELTGHLDVTIVALLRRQDQLVESAYNQLARFGHVDEGITEFAELRREMLDVAPVVERWADAFGDDRVVAIPFEPEQLVAGVTAAVFDRCGIGRDGLRPDGHHANRKLGIKTLRGVAYVRDRCRTELGPTFQLPGRAVRDIVKHYVDDPAEQNDYTLLDYEAATRIVDSYDECNARLAARFGSPDRPRFFAHRPEPEEYARRAADEEPTAEDLAFLDECARRVLASEYPASWS